MNKHTLSKQKTLSELCVNHENLLIDYERALSVLVNSNSNWAMNVSDGDEARIRGLVKRGELLT